MVFTPEQYLEAGRRLKRRAEFRVNLLILIEKSFFIVDSYLK